MEHFVLNSVILNKTWQLFLSMFIQQNVHSSLQTDYAFPLHGYFQPVPRVAEVQRLHAAIQPAKQTLLSLCPVHHMPASFVEKQRSSLALSCSPGPSSCSFPVCCSQWGVILSQHISFFLWSELERVSHFQAQTNKVCCSLAHPKHSKCWSEHLSLFCPDLLKTWKKISVVI